MEHKDIHSLLNSFKKDIDLDRAGEVLRQEKVIDPKAILEKVEWGRPAKTETCPDGYKGRIGIH